MDMAMATCARQEAQKAATAAGIVVQTKAPVKVKAEVDEGFEEVRGQSQAATSGTAIDTSSFLSD
jgi:hypothetical protein